MDANANDYGLVKYAIVSLSAAATVIGSVVGWARYSYLKRKAEVDAERTKAEMTQLQNPEARAYLANKQRLDFLRDYIDKRRRYACDEFGVDDYRDVMCDKLDAIFGKCPNLEAELKKLEEFERSEPPLTAR